MTDRQFPNQSEDLGPSENPPHSDVLLLADLKHAILRHDEVPESVTAFAVASFSFRNVEAEIAQLLTDTAIGSDLVGMRNSVSAVRELEFDFVDCHLRLLLSDQNVGQLSPKPEGCSVRIFGGHGDDVHATVDDFGTFLFEPQSTGTFRIELSSSRGKVTTEWILQPRV
jgi:hypothetical protein